MNNFNKLILITIFAFTASMSSAQNYTGPSGIPKINIKHLLVDGVDNQHVTIVGKIIKRIGDKDYIIADDSGEIKAEIKAIYFPEKQTINETTLVELTGKIDKEVFSATKLEVKAPIKIIK